MLKGLTQTNLTQRLCDDAGEVCSRRDSAGPESSEFQTNLHFHPPQTSLPGPLTVINGTQLLSICQHLPAICLSYFYLLNGWSAFVIHSVS